MRQRTMSLAGQRAVDPSRSGSLARLGMIARGRGGKSSLDRPR
jgi:hypothetical protein